MAIVMSLIYNKKNIFIFTLIFIIQILFCQEKLLQQDFLVSFKDSAVPISLHMTYGELFFRLDPLRKYLIKKKDSGIYSIYNPRNSKIIVYLYMYEFSKQKCDHYNQIIGFRVFTNDIDFPRGVKIGDSKSDIISKFGDDYHENEVAIVYKRKVMGKQFDGIAFYIEDNLLVSVSFESYNWIIKKFREK